MEYSRGAHHCLRHVFEFGDTANHHQLSRSEQRHRSACHQIRHANWRYRKHGRYRPVRSYSCHFYFASAKPISFLRTVSSDKYHGDCCQHRRSWNSAGRPSDHGDGVKHGTSSGRRCLFNPRGRLVTRSI